MTFKAGQVVVGRRGVWMPERFETQRGEWVVVEVEPDGRVLVECLDRAREDGSPLRVAVHPRYLTTPEVRVAEELMR